VVTDYPDADLVENLVKNCALVPEPGHIHAEGYLWGAEAAKIKEQLPRADQDAGFDLLILADVLFNHSEHARLLLSIQQTLKKTPGAQALVFFTPYRPWLLEKDLAFFDLAREGGFTVEKILEKVMDKVMFEEDRGVSNLEDLVWGLS
jgi:nicotinamide N-methyltransferase